jgi:hypothetical protein
MSKADFGKTVMPYLVMALLVVGGGATAWGIFGALGNGKNSGSPSLQEASATPGPALERRAGGEAFESEEHERGKRRESEERDERNDD